MNAVVDSYYNRYEGTNLENFKEEFINRSREGWKLVATFRNEFGFIEAFYQKEESTPYPEPSKESDQRNRN